MEETRNSSKIKIILIFSVFYVFCLYDNRMGITYPLFIAGFLRLYVYFLKKEGQSLKKGSYFYMSSIFLLALSTFLSDNQWFAGFNLIGGGLLFAILVLHNSYEDSGWRFGKYALSMLAFGGGVLANLFSVFKVRKQQKAARAAQADPEGRTAGKGSAVWAAALGLLIAAFLLCLILPLLTSADEVFSNLLGKTVYLLFSKIVVPGKLLRILLMFGWGVLFFFAIFYTIRQRGLSERQADLRVLNPLTGITALAVIGAVYLVFCLLQISYLFTGGFRLPDGYSYSSFARQGFFQLLFVCVLNLGIVLAGLGLFRENKALKILLTFLSGCTYVMIFSSACRIGLYIRAYQLTRLRVMVVAALLVLALILAGVIRSIYREGFPLFAFMVRVVTIVYLLLSLSHMDAWIAGYNIAQTGLSITAENQYILTLSADAADVLLDAVESGVERSEDAKWQLWMYFQEVDQTNQRAEGLRRFNLSRYLSRAASARFHELVPNVDWIEE